MVKNNVYVLMKKNRKVYDCAVFVEQYSHGLSFTTIKHAVRFYSYDDAMKAKKYIKHEFHTVVLLELKPIETRTN